jgi:hypothetical protein
MVTARPTEDELTNGVGQLVFGGAPAASYLAERKRLGMPSGGTALTRPCRWCGASPGEPCRNGRKRRGPHPSRAEAAA